MRRRAPVKKEDCPLAGAAELLGDRWTLLILREAFYGVVRYDDMLADTGAPRSMLSDRLSKLVKAGLMKRETYREPGSRSRQAYVLTEAGRALGTTLIALKEWGEEYLFEDEAPVHFIDKETSSPVKVVLSNGQGKNVPLETVRIKLRD